MFVLVYNIELLLFFVLALIFRKHRMGLFTVGVVLKGFGAFGGIVGMIRNPQLWVTTEEVLSIVGFVVLAVVGYFIIRHLDKKGKPEAAPEAREGAADSEQ